ncbi:MAG: type II toxin-antitoxin system RelE/ParE family toxin [Bacteroidales bacterium]|nr:type II toxin-antitoxin system RelE/ParE family toxin [Bacteroidales bacterium]
MKIKITASFRDKLNKQIDYIAQDKPSAARKFKSELLSNINRLSQMPYQSRQSIFFERNDIRDFIFKGYIVVYKINKEENTIEVFGFSKMDSKNLIIK